MAKSFGPGPDRVRRHYGQNRQEYLPCLDDPPARLCGQGGRDPLAEALRAFRFKREARSGDQHIPMTKYGQKTSTEPISVVE